MSLYTISTAEPLPSVAIPAGLSIEPCNDLMLLAVLGDVSREEVLRRFEHNNQAFVAFMDGRPAAFGWMAKGEAVIGELNHKLVLPEGSRYLWNFRTLEDFRGKGIYPALLQYIMRFEGGGPHRFWIIHAPENKSSLNGIVKAGFHYVGKMYHDPDGAVAIEAGGEAYIYQETLDFMDIIISEKPAASCWNCSSPYLKKRKATCCCAASGDTCTNSSQLVMVY